MSVYFMDVRTRLLNYSLEVKKEMDDPYWELKFSIHAMDDSISRFPCRTLFQIDDTEIKIDNFPAVYAPGSGKCLRLYLLGSSLDLNHSITTCTTLEAALKLQVDIVRVINEWNISFESNKAKKQELRDKITELQQELAALNKDLSN